MEELTKKYYLIKYIDYTDKSAGIKNWRGVPQNKAIKKIANIKSLNLVDGKLDQSIALIWSDNHSLIEKDPNFTLISDKKIELKFSELKISTDKLQYLDNLK